MTLVVLLSRLRQFSTDPKPMDFSAYVAGCTWGPLRLDHVEICEGELAIQGTRIDRVDYATFRKTLSIVHERHRAFNWLTGWESVHSQVTTDA